MMSVAVKFFKNVNVLDSDKCWEWNGCLMKNGYGNHRQGLLGERLVHRISFKLHNGGLLKGICVLHHCDNRRCVNPAHLFLGTKKDNTQDMIQKGRDTAMRLNSFKTHCRNGHLYSDENTYSTKTETRIRRHCRICVRAAKKRYRSKRATI